MITVISDPKYPDLRNPIWDTIDLGDTICAISNPMNLIPVMPELGDSDSRQLEGLEGHDLDYLESKDLKPEAARYYGSLGLDPRYLRSDRFDGKLSHLIGNLRELLRQIIASVYGYNN